MSEMKEPTAVICLSAGKGGMELYALKLARMLSPSVPVTLVFQAGTFLEKRANEIGRRKFELWPVKFRSRTFSPALIASMRELIGREDIKNVIFLGASELLSLSMAFLGRGINVVQRHATNKSRPKKDWLHRQVYRGVDHHVAISEALSENVRYIIPVAPGASLDVIYPSFPLPPARSPRLGAKPVELLHVGRLVPGKGQRDAVRACAVLHHKNIPFRLRLVGEVENAEYAEALKQEVAALRYAGAIEFCGYHRDIADFHESSDVFLYPSYGEGFGNAFNEAVTAGLIPVAYQNTVFPELKGHGFHLHLAKDRDVESLSSVLLQVCRNIDDERAAAAENPSLARTLYAPDIERTKYCDLLR